MSEMSQGRMRGVVRFYNGDYGFIRPDGDCSPDAFVHRTQLDGQEISSGDVVEFSLSENPKRPGQFQAKNVRVIGRSNARRFTNGD